MEKKKNQTPMYHYHRDGEDFSTPNADHARRMYHLLSNHETMVRGHVEPKHEWFKANLHSNKQVREHNKLSRLVQKYQK